MKAKTNIERIVIGISHLDQSLKGPMLKLKLQYFGFLMQRTDTRKDLDAGKD